MAILRIRGEEMIGLWAAVFLHILLLAALLMKPEPELFAPVQPVTVSLAEDIGLEAAAPDPVPESRAAEAPTMSDIPKPPQAQTDAIPVPTPVRTNVPSRIEPRQAPTPVRQTRTRPDTRERRRPDREQTRSTPPSTPSRTQGGASRISDNFLGGSGSSTTTSETRAPAATLGAAERASVGQAIARQLKPHWSAPQGVDVDRLVTIIAFDLNPDGSLAGSPRFVRQTGVNDANRSQADRHKEQAIRAIRLAAPFDLPQEYYSAWKRISNAQFDRNL